MTDTPKTRRTALRIFGRTGSALLTISLLRGALGLPARADAPAKIVLGTIRINALIASYLAAVDVFKEDGLDVEVTPFQAGPPILQAIVAGNVVAGDIGLAPTIIALTRGLPIVAPHLGSFSAPDRPFERIMVAPGSSIRTLDDLKGKRLAFLGPGTVPDLLLGALARRSGIRKEDVELVAMPAASQPAALAQGQVDAIFAIPPADTVAERQYKARTLVDASGLVPYLGLGNVVIRRDFAEAHPQVAQRFYKACIRLARWIRDNEATARQASARAMSLPDDLVAEVRLPLFARNGLPVMPNVWHVYEMLVQAKTIERHPDPARLFNDTVVEPAHKLVLPVLEQLGYERDEPIEQMLRADYPLLSAPVATYYADWERRLLHL